MVSLNIATTKTRKKCKASGENEILEHNNFMLLLCTIHVYCILVFQHVNAAVGCDLFCYFANFF